MHPIKVPETNFTFTRPASMTEEQCFDMPVVAGKNDEGFPEIVIVWQLTPEELQELNNNGGVLYHGTLSAGIAPMWFSVFKPKFPVMPEIKPESKIVGINGHAIKNN